VLDTQYSLSPPYRDISFFSAAIVADGSVNDGSLIHYRIVITYNTQQHQTTVVVEMRQQSIFRDSSMQKLSVRLRAHQLRRLAL
jgi:hypothetical protein